VEELEVVFYDEQQDWWTPPTKLGSPKAFTSSRSEAGVPTDGTAKLMDSRTRDKGHGGFRAKPEKVSPIPPDTPDPYTPPVRTACRKGMKKKGTTLVLGLDVCARLQESYRYYRWSLLSTLTSEHSRRRVVVTSSA